MADTSKPPSKPPQPSKPYPGQPVTHGYQPAHTPKQVRGNERPPQRKSGDRKGK